MIELRASGWCVSGVVVLTVLLAACSSRQTTPPVGTAEPDRYLAEQGAEALAREDWLDARTYFQQIVDGFPQSPFRPDAKLGVGDSYLGEGSSESYVLAANEFEEFLAFYPTNPRADYAQYRLALCHFRQMRAPERDQTETKAALTEFDTFFRRFPDSPLTPQVKQDWRVARDRLSAASYVVGLHYYRVRWYPGAIDRFREILRDDPGFTSRDDVYFYLAESLARSDNTAEAIPYFERLLTEFEESDRAEDARERLQALKTQ
jgi:outer membrane protein assembly factor BamD